MWFRSLFNFFLIEIFQRYFTFFVIEASLILCISYCAIVFSCLIVLCGIVIVLLLINIYNLYIFSYFRHKTSNHILNPLC